MKDILHALAQGHLLDAFRLTEPLAERTADIDDVPNALKSMRRFYVSLLEDAAPADTEEAVRQLQQELYRIVAHLTWRDRLKTAHDLVADQARMAMTDDEQNNIAKAALAGQYYDARDLIFRRIWTLPVWGVAFDQTLSDAGPSEKQYLLSALTLSLLTIYNKEKFEALLRYVRHINYATRMRALTGVAFVCMAQHEAIRLYPEVCDALQELLSDESVRDDLSTLQTELYVLDESDHAQEELTKDIMPKFEKLVHDPYLKMGFTPDTDSDAVERLIRLENLTPEERRAHKEMTDTMRRVSRMYHEGFDVHKGAFKRFYNHSFFATPAHWFLPFEQEHPAVGDFSKKGASIKMMIQSGTLCETDKYAVSLMFDALLSSPAMEAIETASEQVSDPDMEEAFSLMEEMHHTPEAEVRNYLQCLSRFFCDAPYDKSSLFNPFASLLHLTDCPLFADALTHDEAFMTHAADKLTAYQHAEKALEMWDTIDRTFGPSENMLRKRGLCRQLLGRYDEALKDYRDAHLLNPDDAWTLHEMQRCYALNGQKEKQLKCLLRLEALLPDDEHTATEVGLCLISLERWHEAVNRFCKMELEGRETVPALRACAWCYFQEHNYKRAMERYHKLVALPDPTPDDYLNLAHITFITEGAAAALPLYLKTQGYDEARDLLLRHGVSEAQIALMHDRIALKKAL